MQKLSERTANFILHNLRENLAFPWCRKLEPDTWHPAPALSA